MGLTRANHCVWDAASSQEFLPSELGIHEAPSYVVQDHPDGVKPVHGGFYIRKKRRGVDYRQRLCYDSCPKVRDEDDDASHLFLGVTRADDTRTMRSTLLLAAASSVLPTPCKARQSCC